MSRNVGKRDLVDALAAKVDGVSKTKLSEIIDGFFDTVREELAQGSRVEIRNFGSFSSRIAPARKARAGFGAVKMVDVPPKGKVSFKAFNELKDAIVKKSA